ncbi:ABC transporter ATP-binding protein [Thalassomonas actiniarum]|uniref:ABC transporter ATP-binding protein n=1 Tax=Thalassomonas actiniarum TaxID=485447 RepID=A0AAE9YR02_9GAMM|nr:ABC transporter ATP-binding protein [Thalassomonas actiniarum]WDD97991.1 ABC transporter ATP-binding protein [Thalassomonas actiniarum]
MPALINLDKLGWAVGDKHILKDISLAVDKGEVLGIIGPNGAGKTSLLNCLLNQQKDFTGSVNFKGKNISTYAPRELAKSFALVAQKTAPVFNLSVSDIVRMGLLPHKTLFSLDNDFDKHQIELALEKVGLANKIHDAFNTLSGGEQQRVLIARALVQRAEVLVLDEPTNHLDVYYQHQILDLVKNLNITVVMTVHDLNLAAQYCRRLLLLDQGQVIADGPPEKVLGSSLLTQVFRLNCQQELDPVTGKTRVYFHLPKHSTKARNTGEANQ